MYLRALLAGVRVFLNMLWAPTAINLLALIQSQGDATISPYPNG